LAQQVDHAPQDGTVAGAEEMAALYDGLCQLPGNGSGPSATDRNTRRGQALLALCTAMRQGAGEDEPLGERHLSEVASLAPIAEGVPGVCLRRTGNVKTLGTRCLQDALNFLAQHHALNDGAADRYYVGAADSRFGPKTEAAVEAFQRAQGLPQTGVVEQATLLALDRELKGARTAPPPAPPPPVHGGEIRLITGNTRFGNNVALTLDDGPNGVHTPRVLAKLKKHGLKAIFFVNGDNGGNGARHHPALIRQIVEEGHILGNHTNHHKDLTKLGADQIRAELQAVQDYIDVALGYHYPMKVGRPPYGAMNDTVKQVFAEAGLILCLWAGDTEDWSAPVRANPELALEHIFEDDDHMRLGTGGMVLDHDIQPVIEQVMDAMLEKFAAEGFQVVNAGDLVNQRFPGTFAVA
jgi:peptidoglycan/xylan/chitin deacetylase (PgdA/CDA1 family)